MPNVARLALSLALACVTAACAATNDGADEVPPAPDASANAALIPDGRLVVDATSPAPDVRVAPDVAPDLAPDAASPLDMTSATEAAPARRSAGCGKPATGTSSYVRRTVPIRTVAREVYVWVPRTYDPQRAYPTVFRWHGAGGNGLSGGLDIQSHSREEAIIVSPSGLGTDWASQAGSADVELFDTLLRQLGDELCLDLGRVFNYGFSAGGGMTNLLSCLRASAVRGAAVVAGFAAGAGCMGRVAAWIVHGETDTVITPARGAAARDRYLAQNGCTTTTMPDTPAPCVRYQGCAPGYPVVWCPTQTGHNIQAPFAAPGAWSFFRSLP